MLNRGIIQSRNRPDRLIAIHTNFGCSMLSSAKVEFHMSDWNEGQIPNLKRAECQRCVREKFDLPWLGK
jgi:hypothetical protein